MSRDILDTSSGSETPDTTCKITVKLCADIATDVAAYLEERAITDAFGDLMSCEAIEGMNPQRNILLCTNTESLILSCNQTGAQYSLIGDSDFQFPEDIIIQGRNVLVSYFSDGSVRLEPVGTVEGAGSMDGFRGNGTRLDGSEITLIWNGKIYTNHVVILDGEGGLLTLAKY